jgi:hypothetical protein
MFGFVVAAIVAPLVASASPACADPAITSARSSLAAGGSLDVYDVAITVTNRGRGAQPSSLLQSVAVYQDAGKVGQIAVPPLRPNASQTVHYRLQRAVDARPGSTNLRLMLVLRDPHRPVTDCSAANDTFRLSV